MKPGDEPGALQGVMLGVPSQSGETNGKPKRPALSSGNAAIAPVSQGTTRPFWSVMLPTFRCTDLFEETLLSVLRQDPGPDAMEIVVIDDHSPDNRSEEIAARLAPDRVRFHRNETTLGLAGNWNRCIRMSRGHWVHILHQDDLILPGFYERLGCANRATPEAGAAFCQHVAMDVSGRWFFLSELERSSPGLVDNWLEQIVRRQRIECASIVVRRAVYESLGGFSSELLFALDWEMWVRIAMHYRVWFEPTMLACYRLHPASETARLRKCGLAYSDVIKAFDVVKRYLPPELHGRVGRELLPLMRKELVLESCNLLHEGDYRTALARLNEACRYDTQFRFSRDGRNYLKWALKLWLLDWCNRFIPKPPPSSVDVMKMGADPPSSE